MSAGSLLGKAFAVSLTLSPQSQALLARFRGHCSHGRTRLLKSPSIASLLSKTAYLTALLASPYEPLAFEIQERHFQPGDTFVWMYRRKDTGEPSSWERYQVVATTTYHSVTIEMATKFTENEPFQIHHRFVVNLEDHLNAVYSKNDWKLRSFAYRLQSIKQGLLCTEEVDEWCPLGTGSNVQAFEEKFNIFMMCPNKQQINYRSSPRVLRTSNNINNDMISSDATTGSSLVAQPSRHAYTHSWYDTTTGVALYKDFGEYCFSLVQAVVHRGNETSSSQWDIPVQPPSLFSL